MDTPLSPSFIFWDKRMKKKWRGRRREGKKEEENGE